jgi:hypothetical protein
MRANNARQQETTVMTRDQRIEKLAFKFEIIMDSICTTLPDSWLEQQIDRDLDEIIAETDNAERRPPWPSPASGSGKGKPVQHRSPSARSSAHTTIWRAGSSSIETYEQSRPQCARRTDHQHEAVTGPRRPASAGGSHGTPPHARAACNKNPAAKSSAIDKHRARGGA